MPSLGQVAYEAYRNEAHGESLVTGDPLPEWSAQRPEIQGAWQGAAQAVADLFVSKDGPYDS